MAKALIAAIPLGLGLVAAVVVLLALSPGSFGFDSWPSSPAAPPRENAVVIEQPVKLAERGRIVSDRSTPAARAEANRHAATPDGALVARSESPAPRPAPAGGRGTPRRQTDRRPAPAPTPALTKTSPGAHAPAAPAPVTGPVAAPPDVVAVEPTPSVPAVPPAQSGARPAAPSETATAPPAEQVPDSGAQDEGDENGALWILPGFRGPHGHGHGGGKHGHRAAPGHHDDRN